MSQGKSLGPTAGAAAALPVTGANTVMMVLAGLAVVVFGLLLMRAARVRRVRA
jgi:LPXTG-motif cell wall-anchored protein